MWAKRSVDREGSGPLETLGSFPDTERLATWAERSRCSSERLRGRAINSDRSGQALTSGVARAESPEADPALALQAGDVLRWRGNALEVVDVDRLGRTGETVVLRQLERPLVVMVIELGDLDGAEVWRFAGRLCPRKGPRLAVVEAVGPAGIEPATKGL
jgi:hypothetical protein